MHHTVVEEDVDQSDWSLVVVVVSKKKKRWAWRLEVLQAGEGRWKTSRECQERN
jgi:hypothetical protein